MIHVSWDKVDSFLKKQYLQSLTSELIALNFCAKIWWVLSSAAIKTWFGYFTFELQAFEAGQKKTQIPTAIDQFTKISFSAKQFSKIMQNRFFFSQNFVKNFSRKNFWKIFLIYFFEFWFFLEKIDSWKFFLENLIFKNWFFLNLCAKMLMCTIV